MPFLVRSGRYGTEHYGSNWLRLDRHGPHSQPVKRINDLISVSTVYRGRKLGSAPPLKRRAPWAVCLLLQFRNWELHACTDTTHCRGVGPLGADSRIKLTHASPLKLTASAAKSAFGECDTSSTFLPNPQQFSFFRNHGRLPGAAPTYCLTP